MSFVQAARRTRARARANVLRRMHIRTSDEPSTRCGIAGEPTGSIRNGKDSRSFALSSLLTSAFSSSSPPPVDPSIPKRRSALLRLTIRATGSTAVKTSSACNREGRRRGSERGGKTVTYN